MTIPIRSLSIPIVAALAACFPESDRCDPDQRYSYGLCYQIDAAAAPSPDSGSGSGGDPFAHFDDVCAGDGDCAAPTDFCAKYPSDPTGYCTRTGCLADMTRCPTGWGCLDLSEYLNLPGLPSICTKP
jgi:hypothetical protein